MLRILYDLSQIYEEVSPTMVSDAMGLTCCARIVDQRKSLEQKGLLTIRHVNRGKAILKLTTSGEKFAVKLEKSPILARGKNALGDQKRTAYLSKDAEPIASHDYKETPWRTVPMQGRYEDADVSSELLSPHLPEKTAYFGPSSSAQMCVED